MDYKEFIKHTCRLDTRQDMVTINTPPGFLYRHRLWLRRWTMSSNTDQLCKMYLKSDYALRLDRKKHYNLYFWTIHPLSDAMCFWEKVYIIGYITWLANYPFTLNVTRVRECCLYINLLLDLLFLGDVCIKFFSGYLKKRRKEVVLDRRAIFKHYMLTFFLLDMASAIPWNILFYAIQDVNGYIGYVRALRMVRAITIIKLVGVQHVRHGWSDISCKVSTMIIIVLFYVYGFAALIIAGSYRTFADKFPAFLYPYYTERLFLKVLHKTMLVIGLVDIGYNQDLEITDAISDVYTTLFHLLGFIMQLVILIMMMMIVSGLKGTQHKYNVLMSEVEGYCDFKKIPLSIRQRMEIYYDFRYQKNFYDFRDINNVLTEHLQKEIQVSCIKRLIEKIDIFAELSVTTLVEICLATNLEYYLRNDILAERDVHCDSMFVIAVGTVALFDNNKKEVCHLEDGCYLGELAMVFNVELNMPTVVAISSCEIYVLKKRDFENIMRKHKDELTRMHEIAQDKLQKTLHVMQTQGYNFIPPQVVVSECLEA